MGTIVLVSAASIVCLLAIWANVFYKPKLRARAALDNHDSRR
jgi:hypothetical protein